MDKIELKETLEPKDIDKASDKFMEEEGIKAFLAFVHPLIIDKYLAISGTGSILAINSIKSGIENNDSDKIYEGLSYVFRAGMYFAITNPEIVPKIASLSSISKYRQELKRKEKEEEAKIRGGTFG